MVKGLLNSSTENFNAKLAIKIAKAIFDLVDVV